MSSRPRLPLEAIRGAAGQVSLRGAIHDVTPMDGAGFRDLRIIGEKYKNDTASNDDLDTLYRIAARCVPSLGLEEVYHLTIPQLNGIIAMAANRIELVEEMVRGVVAKNGERPAATENGAPAPASPDASPNHEASLEASPPGSPSPIPSAS
jgi:hypothetical protein